jgi:F-type H+-transporting ATPase subunit e
MSRHPNAVVLPEPINVSPLIRFSRWTALGLGVVWGFFRLRQISAYHADIREWEHEKAVTSAADKLEKKKWADREEMRYLMKVRGMLFTFTLAFRSSIFHSMKVSRNLASRICSAKNRKLIRRYLSNLVGCSSVKVAIKTL